MMYRFPYMAMKITGIIIRLEQENALMHSTYGDFMVPLRELEAVPADLNTGLYTRLTKQHEAITIKTEMK